MRNREGYKSPLIPDSSDDTTSRIVIQEKLMKLRGQGITVGKFSQALQHRVASIEVTTFTLLKET